MHVTQIHENRILLTCISATPSALFARSFSIVEKCFPQFSLARVPRASNKMAPSQMTARRDMVCSENVPIKHHK